MQPMPSFLPSPLYPFGHKHIKDPGVLIHDEFETHGLVAASRHSSISVIRKKRQQKYQSISAFEASSTKL